MNEKAPIPLEYETPMPSPRHRRGRLFAGIFVVFYLILSATLFDQTIQQMRGSGSGHLFLRNFVVLWIGLISAGLVPGAQRPWCMWIGVILNFLSMMCSIDLGRA